MNDRERWSALMQLLTKIHGSLDTTGRRILRNALCEVAGIIAFGGPGCVELYETVRRIKRRQAAEDVERN